MRHLIVSLIMLFFLTGCIPGVQVAENPPPCQYRGCYYGDAHMKARSHRELKPLYIGISKEW